MNDLDLGMQLLKAALAGDAVDLYAYSDWLEERDPNDDLAYALRWCARRSVRPALSPHGRRASWQAAPTHKSGNSIPKNGVPRVVFEQLRGGTRRRSVCHYKGYRPALAAYSSLAVALRDLRKACE